MSDLNHTNKQINENDYIKPANIYNSKQLNKRELSLVSRALLVAGTGFISTFFIGLLFQYIYLTFLRSSSSSSVYGISFLTILTSVFIIAAFVLSIIYGFMFQKLSIRTQIFIIAFYCLANGMGFGSLFLLFENSVILTVFLALGLTLVASYAIGKGISLNGHIKLSKAITILFIVSIVVSLVVPLILVFSPTYHIFGMSVYSTSTRLIVIFSSLLSCVLLVCCLIYTFSSMTKIDSSILNTSKNSFALMFGFSILVSLIALAWQLFKFFYYFNRR